MLSETVQFATFSNVALGNPIMQRLLIVDDSVVQLKVLERLLRRHMPESEILLASSGRAALKIVEQQPIDLILTDLSMQEGDGLELIQAIKSNHPLIPVILITGIGSEETAVKALLAGAASYIPKRNLEPELIPTVKNVLALSQAGKRKSQLLTSMVKCESTFVLENDIALVTPLLEYLQGQIENTQQFGSSDLMRVGIALLESLTNAIYHGNLECSSDLRQEDESIFHLLISQRRKEAPYCNRRVFVTAKISDRELEFVIRDQGPGFDVKKSFGADQEMNLERIGGRGLILISTFMDVVYHNATGNELHLIKYANSSSVCKESIPATRAESLADVLTV